jgi:hypothetical protein
MAENIENPSEEKSNVEKMQEESSAVAIGKVDKNILIEKKNMVGKRLMRLLPFQVFILVADADGKTDNKEVAQFREFLSQRVKRCSNPYTQRMFHATVVNYSGLTNRYLSGQIKKDITIVQKAMNYIQECVSPRLMEEIVKDLRELAISIAEASGGFLGMTSPISPEEQTVINELEVIFEQAIDLASGEDLIDKKKLDF